MAKDRGYAWVVCVTSFLIQVVIGGFIYTSGIFYIMFKNGIDASDSALALITSLNLGIIFLVCPAVGMLSDRYGERTIAILGALLSTLGLAASAFTTQVYQLYIFYSVFSGAGIGMMYNPCISILSNYFDKHRRLACACAMCGLGAGSFIIPPLLKALEENYGWRGAILMMAGINSHNLVFCCLLRPATEEQESIEVLNEVDTGDSPKVILTSGTIYRTENGKCLSLLSGMNKNVSSINNLNRSLRSVCINRNSSDIKSHYSSHLDMGVFYKSSNSIYDLPKSCSLMNDLNKRSNNTDAFNKSSINVKCLSKSVGDLEIETEDPKASDTLAQRLLSLFRITPFLCIIIFTLIVQFTIAFVYTHFGNYVLTLGYSSHDVIALYMAMGITSTVSRPLSGLLIQVTQANSAAVILVTNVANGIMTAALPLTTNLPMMYAYIVLFSMLLTPYNILSSSYVMESVPATQASTGFGLLCFFCMPGNVLGAPLAALLYDFTNIYDSSFYLAGGLMVMAGLTMSPPAYTMYINRRAAARTISLS